MPLFGETGLAAYLLPAGMLLVIATLMRRLRRRGRPAPPATIVHVPLAKSVRPSHNADAPDALRRLEVELHETMRDVSATLDSKIAALNCLIQRAEEATARLEGELERARQHRASADRRAA